MTAPTIAAGWLLVAAFFGTLGAGVIWYVRSRWAERREGRLAARRRQEAADLARAEAWFAELRAADIEAVARATGMRELRLVEHALAPVVPLQRKGAGS